MTKQEAQQLLEANRKYFINAKGENRVMFKGVERVVTVYVQPVPNGQLPPVEFNPMVSVDGEVISLDEYLATVGPPHSR